MSDESYPLDFAVPGFRCPEEDDAVVVVFPPVVLVAAGAVVLGLLPFIIFLNII